MRKTAIVVACLLLLSLFMLTASAIIPVPMESGEEPSSDDVISISLSEVDILATNWGAGSEIPFYDPIVEDGGEYFQGVWLSNSEPVSVEWKFYDPTWHLVYTESHEPSVKQQGSFNVGGTTYKWIYADYTTFTMPAFCALGNWVGTPTWTLRDGTTHKGAFNYLVAIENPGSFVNSFFSSPVYFMGLKLPALFWILGLFWIPGLLLLILIIWGRGIEGAVKIINGARAAGRRARAEWKKGSTKKS